MKVLVDTCVWSIALRRPTRHQPDEAQELQRLITHGLVIMIGPIRQELLSGVCDSRLFDVLMSRLEPFEDEPIETGDYVDAARMCNLCRAKGVQGSNTDFLICAISSRLGAAIFTTDKDFDRFRRHIAVRLHQLAR